MYNSPIEIVESHLVYIHTQQTLSTTQLTLFLRSRGNPAAHHVPNPSDLFTREVQKDQRIIVEQQKPQREKS